MSSVPRGRSYMFFFREYPRQTATMLSFLLLAGLVESLGAVSIVPLLASLFGESHSTAPVLVRIKGLFLLAGLEPSLLNTLFIISLAMSFKGLLTLLAFRQTGYVEAEVSTRLRSDLLDNLLRADWSYFVSQPSGSLTYALSTESSYSGMALRALCQTLSHIVQSITYFLAGLFVSWQVMLLAMLCGGLFTFVFRGIIRSVRQAGIRQSEALNVMTSFFTDCLAGAKPLKVMGVDRTFQRYIRVQSKRYEVAARQTVLGAGVLSSVQEPALAILLAAGLFWCKQGLGMDGATLLAMAFFFQRIVSRFSSAQQGMQQYAALEGLLLSLRGKIEELRRNRESEGQGIQVELHHGVELRGVDMSYHETPLLRNFNLTVPFGSITALCGPSGSGKTTVADMISGLIRPDAGSILVDGVALSSLDTQHWRAQIGYVPQEVFLFHDSIRNNVTLGREFSDQDVWDALTSAGARSFVEAAEHGMDSMVGEQGRALSGGQRQRLMIARALIAKPRLLILDEATSGLDAATEREIWSMVASLKSGMAVVAVSHQEAVLAVSDQVLHFSGLSGASD